MHGVAGSAGRFLLTAAAELVDVLLPLPARHRLVPAHHSRLAAAAVATRWAGTGAGHFVMRGSTCVIPYLCNDSSGSGSGSGSGRRFNLTARNGSAECGADLSAGGPEHGAKSFLPLHGSCRGGVHGRSFLLLCGGCRRGGGGGCISLHLIARRRLLPLSCRPQARPAR
jgi:hypothetical protein